MQNIKTNEQRPCLLRTETADTDIIIWACVCKRASECACVVWVSECVGVYAY